MQQIKRDLLDLAIDAFFMICSSHSYRYRLLDGVHIHLKAACVLFRTLQLV